MIVAGIDPGVSGALAIIAGANGRDAKIIDACPMPRAGQFSDDLLDVDAIIAFFQRAKIDAAYIERVAPMPSTDPDPRTGRPAGRGMGATSAFNFGGAVYTVRTCIVGLGIRLVRCESTQWKKTHGLSTKAISAELGRKAEIREIKEASRQKAIALFGLVRFPRIGDHNIAEACLIARHGLMCENSRQPPLL